MCVRLECSLAGQATSERRCPECRFRTVPYGNEESAFVLQDVARREAARSGAGTAARAKPYVLVVTMNEIPGWRIEEVHGDVFGLVVRVRNYFSNKGAQFRTIAGGEVGGYTKMLTDSRYEARERMLDEARDLGANAIVAMRFDCNSIGEIMNEIAAYGTAVTAVELNGGPEPTEAA
jgi:uncharacterized protein YbjQ (UPF0145 family)